MISVSLYELLKGLSDIPLAVLAVVFCVILFKNRAVRKGWPVMFIFLAVSAVMGTALHCFSIAEPRNSRLWAILLALMFESVRQFSFLMVSNMEPAFCSEKRSVQSAEAIILIIAVWLEFSSSRKGIFAFVAFSMLMLARIFIRMIKFPHSSKINVIFILLFSGALLQSFRDVIPGAVVIAHLLVAAALFFIFRLAAEEEYPAAEGSDIQ